MNPRHFIISAVVTLGVFVGAVRPAAAYPKLQIDIAGGTYNTALSETVAGVNSDPTRPGLFTMYVYLNAPTSAELNMTYYVTAALTPKIFPPGGNFGSFTMGSTTQPFSFEELNPSDPLRGTRVNVAAGGSTKVYATGDMVYGNPPLESYAGCSSSNQLNCSDTGDLASHGIYNTYYQEFAFKFNTPVRRANVYNVQTDPNNGPTNNANGTMYYEAFTVDTSFLTNYQVHFDLYSETVKNGDIDINQFAPFSHSARSSAAFTPLPEPGSMMLLGSGIATLALAIPPSPLEPVLAGGDVSPS